MEFIVQISMDKREMAHPRNVARALERLARELDDRFALDAPPAETDGVVRDVGGSIVGRWHLRQRERR